VLQKTRLVKSALAILGIILLAVACYLVYGYRQLKLQSAAAHRTRSDLEVKFQSQHEQYQLDLPIGTPRAQVRKYLDSHKVQYNEWRGEISVHLGDEPDVFPCDRWDVYVSLEFDHAQDKPESTLLDKLTKVSLKRVGHCL